MLFVLYWAGFLGFPIKDMRKWVTFFSPSLASLFFFIVMCLDTKYHCVLTFWLFPPSCSGDTQLIRVSSRAVYFSQQSSLLPSQYYLLTALRYSPWNWFSLSELLLTGNRRGNTLIYDDNQNLASSPLYILYLIFKTQYKQTFQKHWPNWLW